MVLVQLSTVGLGSCNEVVYSWAPEGQRPQEYRTAFFQAAANNIFRPDKVFLMATPEALVHENCKRVQEEIGERLELVPIPRGSSEEELWRIFDTVSSIVPEDARIILDVTHAFRSLPLVLFGVVTYLRRVKDTKLELIVYGAYEARESGLDGVMRAPVFDLTVLADLQEWLQALDAFAIRSDAEKLAGLLKNAQRRPWVTGRSEDQALPRRLNEMARHLGAFSDSVRLLRPLEALQEAAAVKSLSREVEEEAAQWAKPFSHILSTLSDEISDLATDAPERLDAECLRRQLALIEHYVSKDLVVQAVLLGREWLVNWLAWRTGHANWLDSEVRFQMEAGLNAGANSLRDRNTSVPSWYNALVQAEGASDLWNWVRKLRNDVAHCAMNANAASSASIKRRVQGLVQSMEHLLAFDDEAKCPEK